MSIFGAIAFVYLKLRISFLWFKCPNETCELLKGQNANQWAIRFGSAEAPNLSKGTGFAVPVEPGQPSPLIQQARSRSLTARMSDCLSGGEGSIPSGTALELYTINTKKIRVNGNRRIEPEPFILSMVEGRVRPDSYRDPPGPHNQ